MRLQPMADALDEIRIVIADDHPTFRDRLKGVLESEPGFRVVGEVADGPAAIDAARTLLPDVMLLDVVMPRVGGLPTLSAVSEWPTRVIVLAAAISEGAVLQALQLGARGVVLKQAATRDLLEGIRRVVDGKFVVGDGAVECVAEAIRRPGTVQTERRYNLTRRELEIVTAIVAGHNNRDIADRLKISVQTVKHHLTSVFDKTGVSSRLELALFAISHQLIGES
jgi:DNA-binding NarL/FixJ family response regulator